MDRYKLIKFKAGDFAQIRMNRNGEVNPDDVKLTPREFEILAIANGHGEYSYALCLYNEEALYDAEKIKDIVHMFDKYVLSISRDIEKHNEKYGRWLIHPKLFNVRSSGPDGCKCKVCKEFYDMAVPNQPDNTLICYSCRQNPMRAYY